MGAQAVRLSNVDINNALENKDFEILFQPIFDLNNGALARFETFVRWRHASLGMLPPGAFISFFESQGRMSELTRYVLSEALSQYKAWRGPYAPGFSINLALSDLSDEAFASHFVVLLRDHEFPAELVTLECPMPPVDQDLDKAQENFKRLSDTGARLAIEVRGRTNDLLRKIEPFPFDEIKTGGAAILRFARTVRGPGLSAISELLELAEESNAAITAVGVEDQASLSALRSIGFAAAQGNHLGRVGGLDTFSPKRVNEVRELLGLQALSKNDLAALFRTAAPGVTKTETSDTQPQPENTSSTNSQTQKKKPRVARKSKKQSVKPPSQEGDDALLERLAARIAENENPDTIEKSLRLSRPSDRARKDAAIARAKKKITKTTDTEKAIESGDENPAHDLQARLTEEFSPEELASKEINPTASEDKTDTSLDTETIEQSEEKDPEKDVTASEVETTLVENNDTDQVDASAERTDEQSDNQPPEYTPSAEATSDASEETEPSTSEQLTPPVALEDDATPVTDDLPLDAAVAIDAQKLPTEEITSKLTIGDAVAHLLPVVRVGATSPEAPTNVVRNHPNIEVADPAHFATEPLPDAQDETPQSIEAYSPQDENSVEEFENNDILDENPASFDTSVIRTRQRKKKNFLMRKYRIWPNHFWPKSWKRAWQRRAAYQAAARHDRKNESDD